MVFQNQSLRTFSSTQLYGVYSQKHIRLLVAITSLTGLNGPRGLS
jgi:hypothetical protein